MLMKLLHGLLLLSICLSLLSGAGAGSKAVAAGPAFLTSMDLGSGR